MRVLRVSGLTVALTCVLATAESKSEDIWGMYNLTRSLSIRHRPDNIKKLSMHVFPLLFSPPWLTFQGAFKHYLLIYNGCFVLRLQTTCRDKERQYISWWAGGPSTSWCKDTSPPYSLQRQERRDMLKLDRPRWRAEGPPERPLRVISNRLSLTVRQKAPKCIRTL